MCACVWVLLGGCKGLVRQSTGWMGGGVVAILWGLSLGRDWVWVETRSRYVWSGGLCGVCRWAQGWRPLLCVRHRGGGTVCGCESGVAMGALCGETAVASIFAIGGDFVWVGGHARDGIGVSGCWC